MKGQTAFKERHGTARHKGDRRAAFDNDRVTNILENITDAFYALDQEWRFTYLNRQAERFLRRTREELLGKNVWDEFPEAKPILLDPYSRALAQQASVKFEIFYPPFERWYEVNTHPSLDGLSVYFNDISERKGSEQEAQKFISLAENDSEFVGMATFEGNVTFLNEAGRQLVGLSGSAEALSTKLADYYTEQTWATLRDAVLPEILEAGRWDGEGQLRHFKTGKPIDVQIKIFVVKHLHSGEPLCLATIQRDVTERNRADALIREQAALLDHARDAILVCDLLRQVLFWNKSAERLYGWTAAEVIGRDIRELIYRDNLEQFEEATEEFEEKKEWIGELRHVRKDGKEIIVESRWAMVQDAEGNPKSVLSINTDITERKKLETQFLRAQRLESIGTLAGGIAHDLGNALSPILMAVQMLQRKFDDEESQHLLAVLRINAERGGDMIKQVLAFAKGAEGNRITLQLRHLIKEVVKILKNTFPKSIEISYSLPQDLWPVSGDATQLHQVLMNLCVNARDAMAVGGTLTLTAKNISLDENYARMHPEAKPGQYALITVADTGEGIPDYLLDRIFDPFFTTKEQNKGTGLGLSTVMGIVKGHGGFIAVHSKPRLETQFRIYIPAVNSELFKRAEEPGSGMLVGHGETVLVVDDESSIREITRGTLETNGYEVLTASDGTEALAIYVANKEKISAVVMDMMMPYLDGMATIRALKKLDHKVKVIASSALAANGQALETAAEGVKTFLTKPYTAEKLLAALAEILNEN